MRSKVSELGLKSSAEEFECTTDDGRKRNADSLWPAWPKNRESIVLECSIPMADTGRGRGRERGGTDR